MTTLTSRDPQLSSALALVALRSEHPDLPPIIWSMDAKGHLSGTAYDRQDFEAYVAVLGGTPMGPIHYQSQSGAFKTSDQLFVTWQDVEFSLAGIYSARPKHAASAA